MDKVSAPSAIGVTENANHLCELLDNDFFRVKQTRLVPCCRKLCDRVTRLIDSDSYQSVIASLHNGLYNPHFTPAMQILYPSPSVSVRDVTPYLMPFHVGYTGPAPVSTYFHAKTSTRAVPTNSDASTTTLPKAPGLPAYPEGTKEPQSTHIAAFRGRCVHGLDIPLPDGFQGYLLQSTTGPALEMVPEGSSKRKRVDSSAPKAVKKSRGVPRTRSVMVKEETEEDMYAIMSRVEDEIEVEEVAPLAPTSTISPEMQLRPTGKFNSIVVWHPDAPVDSGKDEYIRAIDEWTRLSRIVSLRSYVI